jgi:sporulation protein YlmC with PRC-barrel domain
MRTRFYLGFSALLVVAAATAIVSQAMNEATAQVTTQRQTTGDDRATTENRVTADSHSAMHGKARKASELIGMNVRGMSGDDDIGSISDLMVGNDGRVKYAAVSFGGFLGLGDKLFAVPFEAIEFVHDADDDSYARIDVTEETMKDMEGFDQENWPDRPNSRFGNRANNQSTNVPRTDVDDVDVDVQR